MARERHRRTRLSREHLVATLEHRPGADYLAHTESSDVSLPAWLSYTAASFVWLAYGIIHRDRVITITNICWVGVCVLVVVEILIYA